MNRECENYIWNRIGYAGERKESPYEIIKEMIRIGMIKNEKQALRTLEKWTSKGIYEYGSRLDLGWKLKSK